MVLGGGAFGRCFGYDGGTRIIEISALKNETPQSSLAFCIPEGPHPPMLVPLSWTSQPQEL